MKRLALLLPLLMLMGQDCEPANPIEKVSDYCYGNDYSIFERIEFGYERDGVSGAISAILQGDPSDDRRATVQVLFGQGYCTGVALGPNTVLTAAHCGYGSTTNHRIRTGQDNTDYHSTRKVVHPDYWKWLANGDLEGRKADLMLLYMDDPLPPPYVNSFYDSKHAKFCKGLVAQGWGRSEEPGAHLRETHYVITRETDKYLISRAADVPEAEKAGRICFGDSGGPLYADVAGVAQLAGITTTTMSTDCLVGGTHVKAAHFKDWIYANIEAS